MSSHRASIATLVAPSSDKRTPSDGKPEEPIGAGGPPGGGTSPGKPPLEFGSHSLFDPKLRPLFQPIFRGYLPFIAILSIVVVWGIVPIFWGSLYKLTSRKLVGYVINGDQPGFQIGQTFEDALLRSVNASNPERLHWETQPRSRFPTDESIIKALKTDQKAWVVVQILDNATEALLKAQVTGNDRWDASRVITVWYATARNYQAVPGSVVAPTKNILVGSMNALNVNITSSWVGSIVEAAAGNSTLQASLLSAQNAPQTVGHAVDLNERDVNPFDQSVAVATTFVGLIYILLLAFNITMALFGARQPILPFLRLKHLFLLRLLIPLATNLLVAFLFSLVNLPFQIRFHGYGAGGFFAFFAIMYTGMMVLGLCVEVALEILGPKFVAFGLLFLVILNVSGAGYPIPMLNQFYRISYAMPFYNLRTAFLGLLYSQGRGIDIFISWIILVAWLVLLLAIFPLLVRREQKKAIKMRKAARAGAGPGGCPAPSLPPHPSREPPDMSDASAGHNAPPALGPDSSAPSHSRVSEMGVLSAASPP